MILRRFMQHIKEQNWFAVGLDVIVVIVGIFLGLQVQEWNEGRLERVEEHQYLLRLHDDVNDSITQNNARLGFMERQFDYTRTMLDDLATCQLPEENEYIFANGLYTLAKFLPPIFSQTVMDELNSTGKMLVISNVELRKMLAEHVVSIRSAAIIDNNLVQRAIPHVVEIEKKFTFNINAPQLGSDNIERDQVSFDFDALCRDEQFFHGLSLIRSYGFDEMARVQVAIDQQEGIKAMIEAELERFQ